MQEFTDLVGQKVTNENRQANIANRLKPVMTEQPDELKDNMPSGIIAQPHRAAPAPKKARA